MQAQECRVHKFVVDVTLLDQDRVLLVKYKDTSKYDRQSGWFVPDDLMSHLEHPEAAAHRILQEQVNLTVPQVTLNHIESFRGEDGTWHLIFHYVAQVDKTAVITPSENIKAHDWFGLDRLPAASEVAHGGWALDVIGKIAPRA